MKLKIILFIIFWSLHISAQEIMTLEKALSIGLENNYGLKIAENNIRIAENNNTWARVGGGPTLDLNGSFTNVLVNDNNPASFLNGTFYSGSLGANLDANWVVFSGGRISFAKAQLDQLELQQQLLHDQEIHNTVRDISQQYVTIIYQKELYNMVQEVLGLTKERLRFEETKREFGSSNSYNLIQFENAVVTDSLSLVQQENQIEVAKRQLYQTLNLIGPQTYKYEDTLESTKEKLDIEKLSAILEEENYSLKTLSILSELDRLNSELENANNKPTITINGTLGLSENAFKFYVDDPNTGNTFDTQFSNRINGGLNAFFNWTLIDGGLNDANRQNAKLQNEINQLSLLEAKAQLNNQLATLIENYDNQLLVLDLTELQIKNAKLNLELSEERLKTGQISSLDYRAIQNQFLMAANNRVSAIYNLIISKSEIDWLVGIFDQR